MDAEPRRRWPWVVVVLTLAVVAAGAWWWLAGAGAAEVRVAAVVEQQGPAAGGGTTVLNASGYVTARRRATVASKITGRLTEVNIEEGVPVSEGDVLARLEDRELRAALELARSQLESAERAIRQTRAQLDLAELTAGRRRRLVDDGVENRERLDEAETEVERFEARIALEEQQAVVADRDVKLRQTQLDNSVIRAPFDGIVVSKDAQPGEIVSPMSAGGGFTRTGICTIVDMASLEIEVDVNESYISRVEDGMRVEALLDAYPDWPIPGRVITTVPTADRQKATVLVRIAFDELDPRILPEMGVKVAFRENARESAEQTPRRRLLVPQDALRRDGGRDIVFVVVGDRVERRAVNVAGSAGESAIVAAGLRSGEQVVVESAQELEDGMRVGVSRHE